MSEKVLESVVATLPSGVKRKVQVNPRTGSASWNMGGRRVPGKLVEGVLIPDDPEDLVLLREYQPKRDTTHGMTPLERARYLSRKKRKTKDPIC
jgi:hypothetical protein